MYNMVVAICLKNHLSCRLADEKSNVSGTEGQKIKQFFERDESRKSTLRSRINIASTKPERKSSTNFDELRYKSLLKVKLQYRVVFLMVQVMLRTNCYYLYIL